MELAAAVPAWVVDDRGTAPAAAGSWDMEAPPAVMENPAEVGVAVADIVVVAIH